LLSPDTPVVSRNSCCLQILMFTPRYSRFLQILLSSQDTLVFPNTPFKLGKCWKCDIQILFNLAILFRAFWFSCSQRPLNYLAFQSFEWMSKWLLLNANSAIFQLYHGENKLIFNEMMMRSAFVLDQHAFLVVLFHWNNSPRVDMSLHSHTLFGFRANQSLLILLNAACLAEKQQIPILLFLV
jgi:hypothetical protein